MTDFKTYEELLSALKPLIGTKFFTKKQNMALRLRFIEGRTLEESGQAMGTGRLDCRETEAKAIKRLRSKRCPHCGEIDLRHIQ